MDYLDGQSLHAVLRKATRGGMPLDLHLRILADSLLGLQYAHTLTDFDGTPLQVVHRDVSPQNIFITYDGQVKLVDFGIAKAAGAASTTQSGVFKGKLAYVAPERAGGDPVDARANLFSVGVMMWEAIAGQRFAQGDGQTAMLGRHLSGNEPRIRQAVPTVDPELAGYLRSGHGPPPGEPLPDRARAPRRARALPRSRRPAHRRPRGERAAHEPLPRGAGEDPPDHRRADEAGDARDPERAPVPTLNVFPGVFDPTPITTIEGRAAAERAARALREAAHITASHEMSPGSVSGSHGTLAAAHVEPGTRSLRAR